jgi:hypothetical protein
MSSEDGHAEAQAPSATNDLNLNPRATEYARARKSKFGFKSSKRKSTHDEDRLSSSHSDGHRHRHHHRHHRSKRRKQSEPPDDPALYDDTYLPNASSEQYLDPDTAFRESLFDAMADDEGAQFWEGVYGQPIPKIPPVKEGPTGELEAMTEDEYAAHVRAEMYKKTHQYLFEEKARREQAKKERERLAEEARREEASSEQFRRVVDESLKRGRERRERVQQASQWASKWNAYEKAWDELGDRDKSGAARIPWPVWQGTKEDISKEEIETFFLNGPTAGKPDQADLLRTLKAERVRWHPDKMQQKLGGQGINELKMRAITAVFQIIDRMWNELRDSKS